MLIARFFDPATMSVGERELADMDESALREVLRLEGKELLSARRQTALTWRRATQGTQAGAETPAKRGLVRAEVAVFCRELRALVMAGLSVVEALEALAESDSPGAGAASVHAQLLARLSAGRSLSAAMQDLGGFPVLLVASVRSSERTSNLPEALDAYLKFDDMVSQLTGRVISAAVYPGIVVSLGLVIGVFLLWVVMPRFAALYGQLGQGASGATRLLIGLSQTLHDVPWLVPLIIVMMAAAAVAVFGKGRWREIGLRVAASVPGLHHYQRHFELARVFEALALLVKGGFSFHEALVLCGRMGLSPTAAERLKVAQQAVEQGQSASRACAAAGMTDAVTVRLLRAGERGGDFAAVLHAISARHAASFEVFVERATRLVEPLLLLAVALLIGGLVIMMYMPIFDIAASVR